MELNNQVRLIPVDARLYQEIEQSCVESNMEPEYIVNGILGKALDLYYNNRNKAYSSMSNKELRKIYPDASDDCLNNMRLMARDNTLGMVSPEGMKVVPVDELISDEDIEAIERGEHMNDLCCAYNDSDKKVICEEVEGSELLKALLEVVDTSHDISIDIHVNILPKEYIDVNDYH